MSVVCSRRPDRPPHVRTPIAAVTGAGVLLGLLLAAGCGGGEATPGSPGIDSGVQAADRGSGDPGGPADPGSDLGATPDPGLVADPGLDPGLLQPDIPVSDLVVGQPDFGLKSQPIGGRCAFGGDCATGFCYAQPPGGYCSLLCEGDAPCPAGSSCFVDSGTGARLCFKDCLGSSGCRGDQFCAAQIKACLPKCQPGECQKDYKCRLESGKCVYSPEVCQPVAEICNEQDDDCDGIIDEGCGPEIALTPGLSRIDLGKVPMGGGGVSPQVKFDIPPGAASFALMAVAPDDAYLGLWQLLAPDGKDLQNPTDPFAALNPVVPNEGALAALVPIAPPRFQIQAGTYAARFYRDGSYGFVPVFVLVKAASPASGPQILDINLYFVGTPGLTASNYVQSGRFKDVLDIFWGVLGQAGIQKGKVSAWNLTGADAKKYTWLDLSLTGTGELPKLLATSGQHPESTGLNLYFVQGFSDYGPLGVAGGIPGPPLIQGTASSGVAVSLADFYEYTGTYSEYGVAATAEAMTHEVGHYLGLFHTTERDGKAHDPLTDTPECTDANDDGVAMPEECSSTETDNLMFWSITGGGGLSAQQVQVIRSTPQVHTP